jgi:hypothetical protein
MRFEPESLHDANAGLKIARELMEKIKKEFPWITYGDLWTLGGVAAIQVLCQLLLNLAVDQLLSDRKWPAPRFLGDQAESTVLNTTLHQMVDCQMRLKALTIFGMSVCLLLI